MILRYIGQKPLPYTLATPIPLIYKSEQDGTLSFTPEAEVRDEWADYLLTTCVGAFERVGAIPDCPTEQAPHPSKPTADPTIYIGKRFSGKAGKWNALSFIKRHKAEEILGIRKLQIKSMVIHWELVAIALADVTTKDMTPAWNKGKPGSMKAALARTQQDPDAVPAPAEGVSREMSVS